MTTDTLTAALAQYRQFKAHYPGYLLLFKIGEEYQAFHDDAFELHRACGRPIASINDVPTNGVPLFAVEGYLRKIIASGRKVALCDPEAGPTRFMVPAPDPFPASLFGEGADHA